VNANKVGLLLCNRDTGSASATFVRAIDKIGMFRVTLTAPNESDTSLTERVRHKEAMVALVIPADFSQRMNAAATQVAGKALHSFGLEGDSGRVIAGKAEPVTIYYHPVLQESFRQSIKGAVSGALQLLESRLVLQAVYQSINDKPLPDSLANNLLQNQQSVREISVSRNGAGGTPNAAQHNVPAWTIFAMFFVVLSLGSSVVREKLNGSFVRLKTLPTPYVIALLSKQITYLVVTLLQTALIFAIGIWLFPLLGLPVLHLPHDLAGLFIVSLICGWCAVSYAICVGVFASTQEQANGFGAISILIMAVVGGLMVPSFIMPESMQTFMNISPLHWCLEAYYGLFLEGGKLADVWVNIIPLIGITLLIQGLTLWGLKRKHLI